VALYPKEGTFWHEHPFAIPDADWVTPEQRTAAQTFTEYGRSTPVQEKVLESGFRPVNPDVTIGYPIVPELGVDPNQPSTVLNVPDPAVIAAVQTSWAYVKKQADIVLMDISARWRATSSTRPSRPRWPSSTSCPSRTASRW
jgi:Ca-activated chloride channel family protein